MKTPLQHSRSGFYTGLLLLCTAVFVSADAPKPAGPYYGVFRELPVDNITPQGWLAEFLGKQRDGLGTLYPQAGRPFSTCMWTGKIADCKTWADYEQTGYMTDGLYRAGVLLNDPRLIKLGQDSVNFTLSHPQANGAIGPDQSDFGPVSVHDIGTPVWPLSVFTRELIANYGVTGNKGILDGLTATYMTFPDDFGNPAKGGRNVDSIEGMCFAYGQTGNPKLIEIAERTWKNFTPHPEGKGEFNLAMMASSGAMKGHGCSVCEATKQPALLYLYTGKKEYLDAVMGAFKSLARDHELVDGVISSDEGLDGKKAEGLHETCDISDYTWSMGYVLQANGDAAYGDKIERAVLNAGFGAVDKDFKSHQYFSSPNQVVSNQTCSAAKFGPVHLDRQSYRGGFATMCCTGNVHRFLPNYAARMWMSDNKGGIAATLYGPSTLKTTAGADGTTVSIVEQTDYPFDGAVQLTVTPDKSVAFPLYVRIPGWADGATVTVNGQPVADKPAPGSFLKIDRTFAAGDIVKLNFPMAVREEQPVAGGMSLLRGPLVYSLKIKQVKTAVLPPAPHTTAELPAWDIAATSAWNYALAIDGPQDLSKVKVEAHPVSGFPWTPDSAPVVLTVPARLVPSWVIGADGFNPPLPIAPFDLGKDTTEVQLIPDGATQLRVSVFPVPTPATTSTQ